MDTPPLHRAQALLRKKNGQLRKRMVAQAKQISDLWALQQAIVNHAGQAIIATDTRGLIRMMNQAAEKLLGYAPNELTGLVARTKPGSVENPIPVISYHPYEAATESSHFFQGALAGPGHLQQECVVMGKDGRLVPMLIAVSRLQDKHAKPIGYVGIATDISALKQAQAQLLQKNRELSAFFDGALDMHCISNSQGVISEVNGAFQQALGYSAAELKSIPFLALIHPDEQKYVYQQLLVNILQQPVRNQINQFGRKDGTYRIIEWNAIGIDQVVYGSARDITERQQAEEQLLNLNQRLRLGWALRRLARVFRNRIMNRIACCGMTAYGKSTAWSPAGPIGPLETI